MTGQHHITSVRFHRYKAFFDYTVVLHSFNILVGPNNSGKSTIVGAFRVLAEAIRKARSRNPTLVPAPQGERRGYAIDLESSGIAAENIFYNYDDSDPATLTFRFSNDNLLVLFFPERGICSLLCETTDRPVTSPTQFKKQYNLAIGFVPVLGPVDHDEPLYQREAARQALLTHRAARNFRNIWYHYPEGFDEFRASVQATWPGMDIEPPEVDSTHQPPLLRMFCPEERIPREIYWAGFGFQVWCQMLTHIVKNQTASLFLIDEPDIYLHSDLQRQLLAILKTLGPDIVIATHSTELISEADPDDILIINKRIQTASRIRSPARLVSLFQALGSNLNPVLTQLARTRRVAFVEGKDFQVLARFARIAGYDAVANRTSFAVVSADGFNPTKVRDVKQGIETTLGASVQAAVVFDRDYRPDLECAQEETELAKHCRFVHIHDRKELENFVLVEAPMRRAIEHRLKQRAERTGCDNELDGDVGEMFASVTESLRHKVESRYLARRRQFEKSTHPGRDDTTIDEQLLKQFEAEWGDITTRMKMVPGKEVLSRINEALQESLGITVSVAAVVASFRQDEIPPELSTLLADLDEFSKCEVDT